MRERYMKTREIDTRYRYMKTRVIGTRQGIGT